jgi:hypothetical protein
MILALGASATMGIQPASAECIRLRFENDTNRTIRYLYVSPSVFGGWLDDVLGSSSLYPGDAETISTCFRSDDDNYDFKAVYDDGGSSEWREGVRIIRNGSVWVDRGLVLHAR